MLVLCYIIIVTKEKGMNRDDIAIYYGGETGFDVIYKEGTDDERILYAAVTKQEAIDWLEERTFGPLFMAFL